MAAKSSEHETGDREIRSLVIGNKDFKTLEIDTREIRPLGTGTK